MKKHITILLILFCIPACNNDLFTQSQSWEFLQTVGGFSIDAPYQDNQNWILPVHADVSGLRTITTKPTALYSALSCYKSVATTVDNAIYLTIKTGLTSMGKNASCPAALLGSIQPGKYIVYYRGPNNKPVKINEVSIGF